MSLFSYYRISKPSKDTVPPEKIDAEFKKLRGRTFWGMTISYSLYYMCRLSLNVIKQPLIDDGVLSASQLGMIGSALFFVYAVGKFFNGFIADYCNIKRFMATGLIASSMINLLLGLFGFFTGHNAIPAMVVFLTFAILWGINGWVQSMGSSPGVISLSRWFPLKIRGTYYSIFSSTPYIGEFLSFSILGLVVSAIGWQSGFILSALAGLIGVAAILIFVSDTPASKGLPTVQEYSGETPLPQDSMHTKDLQKLVLRHPGVWIIAISSAFIYITKYAIAGWGVLFLQKAKGMPLETASSVIAFSAVFGILGTVIAGWLSDKVFCSDRAKPALLSGILSFITLGLFLFSKGGYVLNVLYISLFSLFVGVLYCIVAGLMAIDIVPRKATGAAIGIVGISSYAAAGIQDLVSGFLIEGNTADAQVISEAVYDFTPVSVFWMVSAVLAFVLPVINWAKLKNKVA